MAAITWTVRALKASRPTYPDPITLQAGDLVEIAGEEDDGWIWCRNQAGKEGWVPLSYMTVADDGAGRTALSDYDAIELPVEVGEEFQAELEEHGWLWCENAQVERIGEA